MKVQQRIPGASASFGADQSVIQRVRRTERRPATDDPAHGDPRGFGVHGSQGARPGHGGSSIVGQVARLRMGTEETETRLAEGRVTGITGLSALARQTRPWDGVETAKRIAAGEISAVEVAQAAIERLQKADHVVHGIECETFEAGLARASAGDPGEGCFAGVPTLIKDMEHYAGLPTMLGSSAPLRVTQTANSKSLDQFLSTGPLVLGKSTMAEFGLTGTYEPRFGPPTRNPYKPGHTAGGSSSGAGAMVGAGAIPIAHAGDGAGSTRVPGAFNNAYGLKATIGRLEHMASTKKLPIPINIYGIITRSVRDHAVFYSEVERKIDGMAPIGLVEGPGRKRLRVGVYIDPPTGGAVDPQVRAATMAVARELESQGHIVDFVPAPYDEQFVDDFLLYWGLIATGVEATMHLTDGAHPELLENWTRSVAADARSQLHKVPGALWRLKQQKQKYAENFENCDVILSPVATTPPPRITEIESHQDYDVLRAKLVDIFPYTSIQNVSGAPAMSIPGGFSKEGLPIGVQIAAPWGRERRLFEMAYALEGKFQM